MAKSIRGRLVYVLLFENQVVGTWTNLKHLCEEQSLHGSFASYSKLSKIVASYRIENNLTPTLIFTTKDNRTFTIQVTSLQ